MNITKRLKSIAALCAAVVMMLSSPLPQISAAEVQGGIVTGIYTYLNVRFSASTSSEVIAKLYNDDKVTILGSQGNFYKVSFENEYGIIVTGYCSKDYITVVQAPAEPENPEEPEIPDTPAAPEEFESYLEKQGFPESYKVELRKLHEIHPEWVFTALHTGLDWKTVIKNESIVGRNLINKSAPESWRSVENGAYNFSGKYYIGLDGSSWLAASQNTIEYYMDPRNFLNEGTILMFENLSYNPKVQKIDGITSILKNSFMKGSFTAPDTKVTYSYAQTFIDAAVKSKVSPYHLATRALQEQGNGGSSLAHGTVSILPGYFNFFNIGAYTANGYSAVQNGAKYASKTNPTYMLPWTNQYKSIIGGSIWIGTGYINKEQDTLYLQKFDVTDGGNGYYKHQYMTNVQAAESEAKIMKRAYPEEVFNSALEFKIPVYKNMPDTACPKPTSKGSNNNLLESLKVNGQTISPAFNRYTYKYSLNVPSNVSKITVSATANHAYAKISGTGEISLKEGENVITVSCLSSSGLKRNYTLTVTREKGEGNTETVKGDANGDGKVSVTDALTIVRHINGFAALEGDRLTAADVNGDGKVNITDALTIVRFVNGFIDKL